MTYVDITHALGLVTEVARVTDVTFTTLRIVQASRTKCFVFQLEARRTVIVTK